MKPDLILIAVLLAIAVPAILIDIRSADRALYHRMQKGGRA